MQFAGASHAFAIILTPQRALRRAAASRRLLGGEQLWHGLLEVWWLKLLCSRYVIARLAQSAERKALNLVVVDSSPTVGV